MIRVNLTEIYLSYLNDQVGPPLGGPPAKAIKLKSCGAWEDEEECPTDQTEKKRKIKELDIAGKSIMYQSNPRSLLNKRFKKILKARIRDDDDY
jgi:hypothetical protein